MRQGCSSGRRGSGPEEAAHLFIQRSGLERIDPERLYRAGTMLTVVREIRFPVPYSGAVRLCTDSPFFWVSDGESLSAIGSNGGGDAASRFDVRLQQGCLIEGQAGPRRAWLSWRIFSFSLHRLFFPGNSLFQFRSGSTW